MAERVKKAGTSFYSAMRLLPKPRRHAMFAIYAFCREIDDIADSNDAPEEKRRQLQEWRLEIEGLYQGKPKHEIAQALLEPVRQYQLRKEDFIALIDGMQMDADRDIWAPPMAELDLYCDRVASAVGRLSVRAFGAMEPEADDVSYHLGRALQLTNILRDIKEDAERQRLYLPRDLFDKYQILPDQNCLDHPSLSKVCRDLAVEAKRHFGEAARFMKKCNKKYMRPAMIMGAVYHAILDKLIESGWQDLSAEVNVPKWRKIWLTLRHGLL